jgi:hypothetical protein
VQELLDMSILLRHHACSLLAWIFLSMIGEACSSDKLYLDFPEGACCVMCCGVNYHC